MDNNLKIITYNIQHGLKANAIINNIAALAEQRVSLFCLQEVIDVKNKKFIIDELLKKLGADWRAEYLVSPHGFDLGLAILWDNNKIQALNFGKTLLPKLPNLKIYEKIFVKVISKFEKIAVNNIAGKKHKTTQRAALIGNFNCNGQHLRIVNLHLDWQGGVKQRVLQLNHLRSHLESELPKTDKEIFCGDFNSLGYYKSSHDRAKKISSLLGTGLHSAAHKDPTTHYFQTLDHIFVKNLAIVNTEIIKLNGSDHFPLLAEIKI